MEKICRTVIVTGGNRGIGEAISRAFFNNGYSVLIGARTDTHLAEKMGARARFRRTDVRREADHKALTRTALNWTGRLDVYVNCAGFSKWSPVEKVTQTFWREMIETNLMGTFWGCKAAAATLSADGCIINISSLAGKRGSANNTVYCASKFGVNGLTQALAKELGPRRIRVNAVCPAYVETDGLVEALGDTQSPSLGRDITAFLKEFAKGNAALQRLPRGQEIAEACLFLASPQASAITGQCINIDCGVNPQ